MSAAASSLHPARRADPHSHCKAFSVMLLANSFLGDTGACVKPGTAVVRSVVFQQNCYYMQHSVPAKLLLNAAWCS